MRCVCLFVSVIFLRIKNCESRILDIIPLDNYCSRNVENPNITLTILCFMTPKKKDPPNYMWIMSRIPDRILCAEDVRFMEICRSFTALLLYTCFLSQVHGVKSCIFPFVPTRYPDGNDAFYTFPSMKFSESLHPIWTNFFSVKYVKFEISFVQCMSHLFTISRIFGWISQKMNRIWENYFLRM